MKQGGWPFSLLFASLLQRFLDLFLVGGDLVTGSQVGKPIQILERLTAVQRQLGKLGATCQAIDVLERVAVAQVQLGELSQVGQTIDVLERVTAVQIEAGQTQNLVQTTR